MQRNLSNLPLSLLKTNDIHRVASRMTLAVLMVFFTCTSVFAQNSTAETLTAQSLIVEIIETILYSTIGILMGVAGFKVVDWLTPGNLAEEVAHKENRALAILAGSMMLGVCIIIASVLVD